MSVATIRLDSFYSVGNSRFSSAEDFTFLLVVVLILASAFFAVVVPEQKKDTATTIDVRIKSAAPSEKQAAEIPEEELADPQPKPESQLAPQTNWEQPQQELVSPGSKEPVKRLDLSLPKTPAPFKQFGVIKNSPGSNLHLEGPGHKAGENGASTTTYEPYISVFGDIEVRISDRCTMIMGPNISFFDDTPKTANVRCRKKTGKRDIERLFRDIRRNR